MSIDNAIASRLNSHAGLDALIDGRSRPGRAEQNITKPYVTFFVVGNTRPSAMGSDTGVVHGRWQFDIWASSSTSLKAVVAQLILALQRWRQDSGPKIFDTFILNDHELPAVTEAETTRHAAVDVMIHHRE